MGQNRTTKRVKFVLINPTSPVWRVRNGERPRQSRFFRFSVLPSLYVAASMPPYVDTQIIDEDVEPIDFDITADLIGVSFMTYNAPRAYEIADFFRTKRDKPVIFGGYHPTFMPDEAIQHADAVCIGDAEDNVPRMMNDFVGGSLKPFYRSASPSLAGLPIPNRNLILKRNYAPVDALQATRGCSHRCSFCSVAAFHRYRLRTRPIDEVIEELKTLGKNVLFIDDNIIGDREYAKQLFSTMIPLRKRWFSQCGIGITRDEELLRLASRSGCRGLFVGFESLSQTDLRNWGKHSNLGRDYLAVVKKLHAAGIGVWAAFVFGGDEDTSYVFERTLEFLLEANVEVLQATRMTPFPGTPLFDELDRQGRIVDKDWSHYGFSHVVFEPKHMSPETLDAGVAWVLQEFLNRRRVVQRIWRSLRYLSPVVALGVTLPLNLGYRHRKTMDGEFRRAGPFSAPEKLAPRRRGAESTVH
ncbi:MAG: radical SAM protein [Phycisphaerae bacterium]